MTVRGSPAWSRSMRTNRGFGLSYASVEPRLRHALMAQYGPDRGHEAAAEALAFAWVSMAMRKYPRMANRKYPLVANKRAPLVAK